MVDSKQVLELRQLVDRLNIEADRAIKYIESIREKGTKALRVAESVETEKIKHVFYKKVKDEVYLLIERLVELNCEFELADDVFPKSDIPYLPVSNSYVKLKFLTGESPWNFWLIDENVDSKGLQKLLLRKHQTDLLDHYPNPRPADSICFFDRNKVFRGVVLQAINDNRVKVLDCDSNMSKVIDTDHVYKTYPDACNVHASSLRCTIDKNPDGANLWTSDLRDLFCNTLKEATLSVKIIEKQPGHFPSFLVDIEMQCEEEDLFANLKEWIKDRLLPEVKKLSSEDGDSICDFLSSEVLNPYSNPSQVDIVNIQSDTSEHVRPKSQNENNLNIDIPPTNKLTDKVVQHLGSPNKSNSPDLDQAKVFSSPSDEVSPTKDKQFQQPENITEDAVTEKNVKFPSQESNPPSPQVVAGPYKQAVIPPQQGYYPQYSYPQPISYQPTYPSPYGVPHGGPWSFQGPPLHMMHRAWSPGLPHSILTPRHPNYPPGPFSQHPTPQPPRPPLPRWTPATSMTDAPAQAPENEMKKNKQSSDENHFSFDKNEADESVKIANINNINVSVNVMAPEFVPKQNDAKDNLEHLQITGSSSESNDSSVPKLKEITEHVKIRKSATLLEAGQELVVLISHIVSPDEFFVHFVTKSNRFIDKLKDEMFNHYSKTEKVIFNNWREAKNAMGSFCAGKWLEDNHWYRVEVLDWTPGDNTVKVSFVDYGNTDNLPLNCLQPLLAKFAKMTMCANLCHLAEIFPASKNQSWTAEALDFFFSKVSTDNDKMYMITVVPYKGGRHSLSVELYEGMHKTENSVSINDQMVQSGLVWCPTDRRRKNNQITRHNEIHESHSSDSLYKSDSLSQFSDTTSIVSENKVEPLPSKHLTEEEKWNNWDPMAEEYHSARNNPRLDTDDAGVALTGYAAKDETNICKFFAKDGFCWKPEGSCTKEHALIPEDGATLDKEEVYHEAFAELALPSVGEMIEVRVTAVQHIGLFYVQMHEKRGVDQHSIDDEPETLSHMHRHMNKAENVRLMQRLLVPPALGQLVLALYEDTWYRARVISADIDESEVMFVDYGSVATVLEKDFREMEPRYLHLPFQAIECSLANIKVPSPGTEEFEEGSMLLKNSVEGKLLWAKVYDSGNISDEVRRLQILLRLDNNSASDVGEWLVNVGVCVAQPSISWSLGCLS